MRHSRDSRHRSDRSRSGSSRSRRSRSRSRDGKVDIKKIKPLLDRMFFRDSDIIRKGSSQYDDFWKFHDKIQALRVKGMGSKLDGDSKASRKILIRGRELEIPNSYGKKHTVPFSLQYTDLNDYIYKLNPEEQDYVRQSIPETVLSEFLQTLLYFLDFLQKERFTKLRKLREAQAALPIAGFRENIINTLEKNNVLIIAGDTGCGKSTQVPQYLLRAGYTNIACTQPRRIACISLCKRVAYETLNEYGSEVGYQIRFEKRKTQHTKIIFVTEGLLLRQVSTDSMLTNYNVIVLDEVHERHLHGDFLLGIVKCLVYQREDVKVILMSATINIELFQEYFQGLAPILQVPGRLYPIKMQYRPVSVEELTTRNGKLNPAPYVRILQLIDDKFPQDERGDILMFLSGMNEISLVVDAAKTYAEVTKRWIILPLHSMLSIDDQDKVFDYPPEGVRKCIVATNIAETSITIDGIRFVVDSGKVKEMAYDPACKMQRLKEFWISKASAEQRKGRAGRTGPGVCYRLFSESEYNEFQSFSTPEIQRVPLDSLLLQMISIGIPDCRKFPFIEPPSIDSMESSIARLKEQDALTDDEQLTPIGKTLSQLPVDITIGKMLIMGTLFEQVDAVLSLAAALSVQSPYTNWAHRDLDATAARKSLESDHGDPLTLLNAYRAWLEEKAADSSRTKKWCKRRGLEEQRFYEMTKLRQQFRSLLKDAHLLREQETSLTMSSSDRALRHGELRQLRSIKREYHMAAPRKIKILKVEDGTYGQGEDMDNSDEDDPDAAVDIRDVDFRLRNDAHQVKDLLHKSTPYGYEDITMLKLILCSGLYPQIAIADDFNKYKNDADQVYHTRGKGFTLLHPTGIFSNQSDVLKLTDSDIIIVPNFISKHSVSNKHQLLVYLTLLETNKPYLMNCIRMPAVQTLLLFAHSIDTDSNFGRFIFDSWLEVEFVDSSVARLMILTATRLRSTWTQLIAQRLSEKDPVSKSDLHKSRELAHGLVSFLRTEAFYTVRRLLAADQKDMYDKTSQCELPEDYIYLEENWKVKPNICKGGVYLTPYLTYGCLYSEMPDPQEWTCPICECNLMSIPIELLIHQIQCIRIKQTNQEKEVAAEEEDIKARPFAKGYYCTDCEKQLNLTPVEILRHKKSHTR